MQVIAIVHEENGVFGVSFPDFPGCTTVADSFEAAAAKAAEVLAFHVEGMVEDGELPRARNYEELKADLSFREDSEGAVLILVPYTPPARAARVNVTIEESLLERIDREAERIGETRSGYLSDAAKRRLQEAAPPRGNLGIRKINLKQGPVSAAGKITRIRHTTRKLNLGGSKNKAKKG